MNTCLIVPWDMIPPIQLWCTTSLREMVSLPILLCGCLPRLLQALRSTMMAIATKTGLAPGVNLASLRPIVQEGLLLSMAPPLAPAGGTPPVPSTSTDTVPASAEPMEMVVEEELGQEAKAEMKAAVMLVRLRPWLRIALESGLCLWLGVGSFGGHHTSIRGGGTGQCADSATEDEA